MAKDAKKLEARVRELEAQVHIATVALIRIGTFNPMSLPPTKPGNIRLPAVVHKQKVLAANALYRIEPDPEKAEALVKKHALSNVPHGDWEKPVWQREDLDGD